MSVRFNTDGSIVIDTVSEALVFEAKRRNVKRKTGPRATPTRTSLRLVEPIGWEGFCQALERPSGTNARKILALLKGTGDGGVGLDELADAVGLPTNVISGTVSGILKRAIKFNLAPKDVILREARWVRAGPLLRSNDPPTP